MNYVVGELYSQPEPTIIAAVTQEAAKVIFFFLSRKAKVWHDGMSWHVLTKPVK